MFKIDNKNTYTNYKYNNNRYNSVCFKGKLEDDYFEAAINNDVKKQLSALSSIDFDISCKEPLNQNNFLHIALINGNNSVIKKALALLRNKKKSERIAVITQKNNEGFEPGYYASDEETKLKLKNLIGMELPNENTIIPKPKAENQLNELSENEEIKKTDTISFFDLINSDKKSESIQEQSEISKTTSVSNDILPDVIGHNDVKEKLRKLIIEPYKNNEYIPINGFLLYGASGIGKTLIVKSLFKELNENFEIISSLSEFEQKLEEVKKKFETTKKQTPVYIDNIDVLLPKIENGNITNNVKTTRLMQLIESSSSKGLILIAATDKKYSIEPNAITSNRFDEHIEVSPLTQDDRINLIKFYTKGLNLDDETIKKIAKDTSILSPSAIESLLKKVQFLNKHPQYEDFKTALIEYAKDKQIDISERGKTAAYDTVFQREVIKEYDPKSLDEVKGMNYAKNTLYNTVIASFDPRRQQEYKENRINIPNGILLYGPPGCGKTYIIKAVSAQAQLPLYQIKMSEFGSKWVSETSNKIKQLFDQLRTKYKNTGEASILFFDECDSFFRKIGENEQWRTDDINTLKEEMNNSGRDGIIVVAATNEITNLNDAIVRDGRFDDKIFIDLPDEEARFGLIEFSLENRVKTKEISTDIEAIKKLTKATNGFSSAGITSVINKMVKRSIDENLEKVTLEDLLQAFKEKQIETEKMKAGGKLDIK